MLSKWQKQLKLALELGFTFDKQGNAQKPCGDKIPKRFDSSGSQVVPLYHGSELFYPMPVRNIIAYKKYGNRVFEVGAKVLYRDGDKNNLSWDNIVLNTAVNDSYSSKATKQNVSTENRVAYRILDKLDHVIKLKESGFDNNTIIELLS